MHLCPAEEDGLSENGPDNSFIAVWSGEGTAVAEILGHVYQRLR